MRGIDDALIYQVGKLVNAANTHAILRRRSKELNDFRDFLARMIDELPFIRLERT